MLGVGLGDSLSDEEEKRNFSCEEDLKSGRMVGLRQSVSERVKGKV